MEEEIRLCVGSKVIINTNIDKADGLVNGALGYVEKIDYKTDMHGVAEKDINK